MSYTTKTLNKSQVELTITVEPNDYAKHLTKAAEKISHRTNIKGFRSGKAPYEIIKKEVGDMAILQEALEAIVQETFYQAVTEEKIETIGMPKIEIEKIAPDNPVVYKATVALLPSVKLPDIKKIKVERKVKEVGDKHINEVIDNLRKMHAKEVLKTGVAEGDDKLIIDMNMFLDKVPVEGGQAKNYQVYLSEDHYIPGFNNQIKGLKKDEEKEFSLDFPPTHYQKHLAGKNVQFKVKIKDVFERQLPELSTELAKILGQESLNKLKELIKNNLLQEAEQKADQQFEIQILDDLISKTEFAELPDLLIDAERQKMFYELKRDLDNHGISVEQYFNDINKTQEEIYEGFKEQAEKRAKTALISRQVAKDNNIHVHDEEINKEIKMMEEMYKDNKEYMENLKKPEVRDTIAMTLQNRKVMQWLRAQVLDEQIPNNTIHKH